MMDIDQLQSVRDRERATDDLQELRESFYADAAAFIRELRAERAAAAEDAADPFDSPRVSRLTDRIRTAERTLEAIYEKRVGKVVKAATFAAADLPAEADGMTAEEADLFETLVAEIQANREEVMGAVGAADDDLEAVGVAADDVDAADAMAGSDDGGELVGSDESADGASADPGDDGTPTNAEADDAVGDDDTTHDDETVAGDETDGEDETVAEDETDGEDDEDGDGSSPTASSVERERVRITDDVGAILGVDDREYDLAAGEVVTLPSANARPLIDQGVAERLE